MALHSTYHMDHHVMTLGWWETIVSSYYIAENWPLQDYSQVRQPHQGVMST